MSCSSIWWYARSSMRCAMLNTVVLLSSTVRRYSSRSPSGLMADVASSSTAYLGWWKNSRANPAVVPSRAELRERGSWWAHIREVETPSPLNSPHDHMMLRVYLVDSHTGGGNALAFKQPT